MSQTTKSETDPAEQAQVRADLRSSTVTGVSWTALSNLAAQLISFGIMAILARLLTPRDFGLLAMVMVFVGYAALFQELGFSAALIQRPVVDERHYYSAFWMNLFMGIVLTLLFIILAPILARFYGEPILTPLTTTVSLTFVIGSASVVQGAIISRRMEFRTLGLVDITSVIVSGVAGITFALLGFGVWSLALRQLGLISMRTAGLWLATRWLPQLRFDWSSVRDLFSFSANLLGFRSIYYWTRSADTMLIGRFLPASELGYYSRAQSTILLPQRQVGNMFGRVMFPALSRIQDDKAAVRRTFLRVAAIIMLVLSPMMVGLFVVSEHFVLALYGPQWVQTIPILRIFCVIGLMQTVATTTTWIYHSQGRTDLQLRWGLVTSVVTLTAFGIGIYMDSIEAVAWWYLIAATIGLLINIRVPGRLINMSVSDYGQRVAPIIASSVAMAAAVWVFDRLLPPDLNSWQHLFMDAAAGFVTYWAIIRLARLDAFADATQIVLKQWPGLRKIPAARYFLPTLAPVQQS